MALWPKKRKPLKREQSLAARPVRLVEPELVESPDGSGRLKVRIRQKQWHRWLLRLPEDATKTFELDQIGMTVWKQCDGKTSVQQLIRRLARQYNISTREAEVAMVKFLEMLIKKGLIGLVGRERGDGKAGKGGK